MKGLDSVDDQGSRVPATRWNLATSTQVPPGRSTRRTWWAKRGGSRQVRGEGGKGSTKGGEGGATCPERRPRTSIHAAWQGGAVWREASVEVVGRGSGDGCRGGPRGGRVWHAWSAALRPDNRRAAPRNR
eukprot:scaffold1961_cov119-Isochrysis_galbana.AAC.4